MSSPSRSTFSYPFVVELQTSSRIHPQTGRRLRVVDQYPFRVRPLTRAEFTQARSSSSGSGSLELEDYILRAAVLETPADFQNQPWDWDRVYAGIAQQVVEKVLGLSGFGCMPDPLVTAPAETYLAGEESRYDLLILMAFNYRLEELWEMAPELWYRLIGLAEMKLALLGVDPQQILNPTGKKAAPKASVTLPPSVIRNHPRSDRSEVERAFSWTSE
jgi:hypothetical protein